MPCGCKVREWPGVEAAARITGRYREFVDLFEEG